jgi:hypothetical protein
MVDPSTRLVLEVPIVSKGGDVNVLPVHETFSHTSKHMRYVCCYSRLSKMSAHLISLQTYVEKL